MGRMGASGNNVTRRQACTGLTASLLGLGLPAPVSAAANALATALPATLTVAAFPSVDKIVTAAIPAWKKLHPGVDIKVVSRQFTDHHTAMTTALSTAVYLPDVMALEVGYVGRFAQFGGLENLALPAYGIRDHATGFVRYALDQASGPKGAIVAAPTDIGPGTLLWRADILSRAGVSEAELTHSWDSYVSAGIRVKQATGAYLLAHARDMKDILIRVGIQPGEGLYFSADSRVLVNTPRFARAFELARRVRQHQLDARVTAWSTEWSEGFRRGTLATQMSGAWLAGHLANWLAPQTRGQWRASQLPDGAWAAYGGTFYAIPRSAPEANKRLAWEFIKLLTLNREMQLGAFKAEDAFPALVTTYDDAFFDQPIPFLGGGRARLLWREAAGHIRAVAVHKQDAFAGEVIDTELDKVLVRGKDISLALADAARLLEQRAHR